MNDFLNTLVKHRFLLSVIWGVLIFWGYTHDSWSLFQQYDSQAEQLGFLVIPPAIVGLIKQYLVPKPVSEPGV